MAGKDKQIRVAVIGAGAAGIATAIEFKKKLGIDVQIFDREVKPGGTWHINTYPGCACDIPSHWYSLSNEQNPNWSHRYSGQEEIAAYFQRVFDKHDMGKQTRFGIVFFGADWDDARQLYVLRLAHISEPKNIFTYEAEVLINATGGFSSPLARPSNMRGLDQYQGACFHSARWDHSVSLKGKRVAVIGNGCSAAQFIPIISQDPSVHVINFSRTPNWLLPRANLSYSSVTKWAFTNVPFIQTWYRAFLVFLSDSQWPAWWLSNEFLQKNLKALSIKHIKATAPAKYHDFLIPDYPVGCKRIILDPGYLQSLNQSNVELVWDPIKTITETGVECESGKHYDCEVLILGTGFDVGGGATALDIRGPQGRFLKDQWAKQGGPQSYLGTTIAGFPNYFTFLGANVATGHSSAVASIECQVHYAAKMVRGLQQTGADAFVLKDEAERKYNSWLQKRLEATVWNGSCKSYYKLDNGKIFATWPGTFAYFWWLTRKPKFSDYEQVGGTRSIRLVRMQETLKSLALLLLMIGLGGMVAGRLGWTSRIPLLRQLFG